jgi:hypothetical protein
MLCVVRLLVDCWQHLECCGVEDGAFVPFEVSIRGNELQKLRTVKGLSRNLSLCSSILCIFGHLHFFLL